MSQILKFFLQKSPTYGQFPSIFVKNVTEQRSISQNFSTRTKFFILTGSQGSKKGKKSKFCLKMAKNG